MLFQKRDDNAYDEECVGKREQKNDKHQALSASFEQIASKRKEGEIFIHMGCILRDEIVHRSKKKSIMPLGAIKSKEKSIGIAMCVYGKIKLFLEILQFTSFSMRNNEIVSFR